MRGRDGPPSGRRRRRPHGHPRTAGCDTGAVTHADDPIRLGQFLKLGGIVDTGGQARALLEDGAVTVNGQTETRRGRQLQPGDVVEVDLPAGVRRATVQEG